MHAVTVTGPDALEIAERPPPQADGGAVIEMELAGICGTDVKILHGKIPVDYPRVMGHELVGTIVTAQPDGSLPAGTRVLANPGIFCGVCNLCRRDLPHLCRQGGLLGRDIDGVFAGRVMLEEQFLHRVPEDISADASGLLQVFGTVVHAQRTVSVLADQAAVVIGLGVSGLLHAQMLLARGVGQVIGITRSQWKRDLASELGVHVVCPPEDAADVVAKHTSGAGADVVIESVGIEATFAQAIELAGFGADIVLYGTATQGGEGLPYYQLYLKELTIHNPRAAAPGDYDSAIELAARNRIQLAPLVTSRFALSDAAGAFAAVAGSDQLKVLLTPR